MACEIDGVFDAYPYTLNGSGPEYLVHLGVLRALADKISDLLSGTIGGIAYQPASLFGIRAESEGFESVCVGQLSAEGFLEPFETMHACINDLRMPLGRPDFSAQTIVDENLIPSMAKVLRQRWII